MVDDLRETVERIESKIDLMGKVSPALNEALKAMSLDMHNPSSRPCSTCQAITNIVGWPFGCAAYRILRQSK